MGELLRITRPLDYREKNYNPIKVRIIKDIIDFNSLKTKKKLNNNNYDEYLKEISLNILKNTDSDILPKRKYNKPQPLKPYDEISNLIFGKMIKSKRIDFIELKEITDYLNKSEEKVLNYILLKSINTGMNFISYSEFQNGFIDGNEIIIPSVKLSDKAVRLAVKSLKEKKIIFTHNFSDYKELLYILNTSKGAEIYEKIESGVLKRSDCRELIKKIEINYKDFFELDLEKDILPITKEKITELYGNFYQTDRKEFTKLKSQNRDYSCISKNEIQNDNAHYDHMNQLLTVIDEQEKNLEFCDNEKFKILSEKIESWLMPLPVFKSLISKYGINKVFYCVDYLEKREKKGFKIDNFGAYLTKTLKNFNLNRYIKSNKKEEKLVFKDKIHDEEKYFNLFKLFLPEITINSIHNNWYYSLNLFSNVLFNLSEDIDSEEKISKLKYLISIQELKSILLEVESEENIEKVISKIKINDE